MWWHLAQTPARFNHRPLHSNALQCSATDLTCSKQSLRPEKNVNMIKIFWHFCGQQKKRVDNRKLVSAEEDVTEGDLGLGKIAQLDICTGTAVCSTSVDVASNRNLDTQDGTETTHNDTAIISALSSMLLIVGFFLMIVKW